MLYCCNCKSFPYQAFLMSTLQYSLLVRWSSLPGWKLAAILGVITTTRMISQEVMQCAKPIYTLSFEVSFSRPHHVYRDKSYMLSIALLHFVHALVSCQLPQPIGLNTNKIAIEQSDFTRPVPVFHFSLIEYPQRRT